MFQLKVISLYFLITIGFAQATPPVKIYVGQGPVGITQEQWRSKVCDACFEWAVATNRNSIQVVDTLSSADIIFQTKSLCGENVLEPYKSQGIKMMYGYCDNKVRRDKFTWPSKYKKTVIMVATPWQYGELCLKMTLLHEIGHSLGLDHRPNSVMEQAGRHYDRLQLIDLQDAAKVRIESNN